MEFIYKKNFLKCFECLPAKDQALTRAADEQIRSYYQSQKGSYDLRIKQLYRGKKGKILEARLNRSLRILWAEGENQVAFILIGTHDEVRNFLRSLP